MGRQGLSTRTWRHSAMVVLFSAVAGVLAAALGAAAAAAAASASSASSIMSQLEDSFSVGVDWSQASLHTALAFIVLCPVFWNVMARCELRWQLLSRQIGSPVDACYALAAVVFGLGFVRDYLVDVAMREQPSFELRVLDVVPAHSFAQCLVIVGTLLVLSSFYRLGVTGTYMGDYFGIVLEERVTSFPFSIMNNPMYNGSSLIFFGLALLRRSIAGIFLAAVVFLVYRIAAKVEEPYTDHVYASKSKKTAIAVSTSPPSSPPSTPIKSSSATLSTSPRFSLQQQQQIPFGISKTADAVSSFSPKHLVTKTSRAFGASKSFLHSAAL